MQASRFLPSAIQTLTLTILLLAVGSAAWAESPQPSDGDGKPAFRTEKVKRDALKAAAYATGTVEPEEVIDVGAQVAGAILKFGPADAVSTENAILAGLLTSATAFRWRPVSAESFALHPSRLLMSSRRLQ
jgi:hypothetical protein